MEKSESWRQALKFIGRCPACGAAYAANAGQRFAGDGRADLVHLTCLKCSGHFIALVMSLGHGLSSIGMMTDLSLADAERLLKAEPFSLDEALEACRDLPRKEKDLFASILKV